MSVSGTLSGARQSEKITAVNGYEVDLHPAAHLAFLRYGDRPGVVGAVKVPVPPLPAMLPVSNLWVALSVRVCAAESLFVTVIF